MYCHGTWTQWSLGRVTCSHMWPQQTWGQRSSRGQWPLVQVFGKKGQCIHILWCIFKSNISMIAKVCDRESRRDSWFGNRLIIWGGGGEKQSAHCGRVTLENGVKGERFRLSGEVDTPEIIFTLAPVLIACYCMVPVLMNGTGWQTLDIYKWRLEIGERSPTL